MAEVKANSKQKNKLIENSIKILLNKKAVNLVEYDLRKINNAVADYFIICSGTSRTHIQSLADSLYKINRKELKNSPWHIEGEENAEWILLDYVDVVVHIFSDEMRDFYKLEELWADAKTTKHNE